MSKLYFENEENRVIMKKRNIIIIKDEAKNGEITCFD
jgi:hypothetical protein